MKKALDGFVLNYEPLKSERFLDRLKARYLRKKRNELS